MRFIEDNNKIMEMIQEFEVPNYYDEDDTDTIELDMEYKYCPYCGRKLKGEFKKIKIH